MNDDRIEQLILMSRRRLRARGASLSAAAKRVLRKLDSLVGVLHETDRLPELRAAVTLAKGVRCRVIDSIRGDGPKLIEVIRRDIPALRAAFPELDLVPVVHYRPALAPRPAALSGAVATDPGSVGSLSLRIVDSLTGRPVQGAQVVALTNFATREGRNGVSDEDGLALLAFETMPVRLERLYVYPPLAGYWGLFQSEFVLNDGATISLQPIDLTRADSLRHFFPSAKADTGAGVTVGVIDGGVGPHADLVCEGDADNGSGHGTHVAGIIASRGTAPAGVRGIAPGARIRSYRAFGSAGGLASNFSVAKAIDAAVRDGCDILNMSFILEDGVEDPAVRTAIEDAREGGVLPVAATGNSFRQSVGFPARDSLCLAVSALGRRGTFPDESVEAADVMPPFGLDSNDYIAAFSNAGLEVDLTAPGAGVVSTVPGGYGVLSGTSMACPVVSAMAARMLARNAEVLGMPRGSERSARLAQLVLGAAASLGFPADLQGAGIPYEGGDA